MLNNLKNKLLLRLFGIKPKSKQANLPPRLSNFSNNVQVTAEDFNNWSHNLFIKGHRN